MPRAQQTPSFPIDDGLSAASPEDLDEVEEREEEQEEEEQPEPPEEEEVDLAPATPPPGASVNGVQPHRPAPKPPKSRRKGKGNSTAARATQPRKWPEDPEEMWPAVLKELPSWQRDPSEVRIQVWIMRGVGVNKPRKLEPKIYGDTVLGDEPGQMLMDRVIDEFHIRTRGTTQMPTSYQLRFVLSDGGWIGQSGIFDLDPYEQLERARRGARGHGFGAPPPPEPYGYPPPPSPYGGGYPYEPSRGYGRDPRSSYGEPMSPRYARGSAPTHPQQPLPPLGDITAERMRDENIFLRGQLQKLTEEMTSIREGRPFDLPPVAPSQPQMNAADIAAAVITGLQAAGVVPHPNAQTPPASAPAAAPVAPATAPAAVGAGAPAAPAASPSPASQFEGMVNQMFGMFMQSAMKRAMGAVQQSFNDPEPATTPEAAATVEPPKEGDEDLPFKTTAIPEAKWPDGRPVIYPRNKETGKLDLTGAIMANPYIAEKGMELAGSVIEVGKDVLRRIAAGGQPHIIGQIPPGAVDGTPQAEGDGGEQPSPWQRQPI